LTAEDVAEVSDIRPSRTHRAWLEAGVGARAAGAAAAKSADG